MNSNIQNAYSETYEVLQLLGSEFINKIPKKFMEHIEKEKNNNYIVNISPNIPLEEQELLEDTINILAMLKLDYWCENEEKKELKRILAENEEKYQAELREKFNSNNIFKVQEKENGESKKDNQLLVMNKEKWYKRILNYFRNILKK